MQAAHGTTFDGAGAEPPPQGLARLFGRGIFRFIFTIRGLGAFALITLGVLLSKWGSSGRLMRPAVRGQIKRSGLTLLPMILFLSAALGFLVIGQAVSWLTRLGAINYLGSIMVLAVVRELGPLLAAFLVLARVGAANVIELGTARATGEVEALEALGVDPVHYLVAPRVVGMAVGVFALTVYLIIGALLSGYVWAFLQDVPLRPGAYLQQLAGALGGLDFALLGIKTVAFGFTVAIITCYHGLAQPLRLEEVPRATIQAVAQSVIACVLIDTVFILIYLTA